MRAKLLVLRHLDWAFERRAFRARPSGCTPHGAKCFCRSPLAGDAFGSMAPRLGFCLSRFPRPEPTDCALHGAKTCGGAVGAGLLAMLLSFGFVIWRFGRRAFLGPADRLRPARRVTFANRGKSNQNRLPLHPAPASPGSPRSGAVLGARHEGPSMALAAFAASLPLNPFHDTCARPADGANWCGLLVLVWQSQKAKQKSRKAEAELL